MDIFYPLLIGSVAGLGTVALLLRVRGAHMLLALVYASGSALSALFAHMACFYPLQAAGLTETAWIDVPVTFGIIFWTALFIHLCAQHKFESRKIAKRFVNFGKIN